MEHFAPLRWKELIDSIHRHWPDVPDAEIYSTGGNFKRLSELLMNHSDKSETETRNLLAYIFDETQTGNPNTIDDFSGIDRAQSGGPPPDTNEWRAREEE